MLKLNDFRNGVNLENFYNTVQAILCQDKKFKFAMSCAVCEPNHEILFDFLIFFLFELFAIKIPNNYNTCHHISYLVLVYPKKIII